MTHGHDSPPLGAPLAPATLTPAPAPPEAAQRPAPHDAAPSPGSALRGARADALVQLLSLHGDRELTDLYNSGSSWGNGGAVAK